MSFGESVFLVGFNQKTIKVDQHVRFNYAYPQRNGHQKTLEDSGGLHTKAEGETPPSCPAPMAHLSALCCYVGSPPPS